MEFLDVWLLGFLLPVEDLGGSVEKLLLPLRNLVRMHIELLRQFGQRLVALQGSDRHLGLEFRRVIPPLPSLHAHAPLSGRYAACG